MVCNNYQCKPSISHTRAINKLPFAKKKKKNFHFLVSPFNPSNPFIFILPSSTSHPYNLPPPLPWLDLILGTFYALQETTVFMFSSSSSCCLWWKKPLNIKWWRWWRRVKVSLIYIFISFGSSSWTIWEMRSWGSFNYILCDYQPW